jgi:hypothetical protein
MRYLLTLFAALFLCTAPSRAQQLKTVMVNTNGVVQFPTNFWQTNAGTNFQQFIAPFSPIASNDSKAILLSTNTAESLETNALGISLPHALVRVGNDVFAFRRDAATGQNGNAQGVVFRGVNTSLTNSTAITITNGGAVPDAVYDASNNTIYVFATGQFTNSGSGGGIYALNPSNLTTSLVTSNTTDIVGALAHYGDFLYLGGSNVVTKIQKSNGTVVGALTNTNLGATSNNIHALEINAEGSLLVGSTVRDGTNAALFAITLSNFATANTTFNTNGAFGVFTDDFTILGGVAYFGAEGGSGALVSYNLTNFATQTLFENTGKIYFVENDGTNVVFGGVFESVSTYNPSTGRLFKYSTSLAAANEAAFVDGKIIATTYESNSTIARIDLTRLVSPGYLNASDVSGVLHAPQATNIVATNTNNIVIADTFYSNSTRSAWINVSGTTDANININVAISSTARQIGDNVIVKNDGTNSVNVRTGLAGTLLRSLAPQQQYSAVYMGFGSAGTNAWEEFSASSLGLGLPALTNTSNVTMMRALAGSTNTNQPFSGTFTIKDENSDNRDVTISNGIVLSVGAPY